MTNSEKLTESDGQSYRSSHTSTGYGKRYARTYRSGYYATQWTLIEKPLLAEVVKEYAPHAESCLDFACGTGRISSALAELCPHVTGVDVSSAMLEEAVVPGNVQLVERDLTLEPLDQKFDLATAFRFFLNAEDELRIAGIEAIRGHLKDGGVLVCNMHMASSSPMGLVYRALRLMSGRTVHKVWSKQGFVQFLERAGLRVERVVCYGYLPRPGRFFPGLCERLLMPFEKLSKRLNLRDSLAQSVLVVCRKVG